tara:strand:+ start:1178 stop:2506 length:1329 start_codon:yes stop_codon:yes gene_type:complete
MIPEEIYDVIVIGGGYSGLNLTYKLSKNHNLRVLLVEESDQLGGLASTFYSKGIKLEKFYHHWFIGDKEIMALIDELGLSERLIVKPSRTGVYYANSTFRLSTPIDVLKFKPLTLISRIRLGLGFIYAKFLKDTSNIEGMTSEEWLTKVFGNEVYEKVWKPLLVGKFGEDHKSLSAVWMWKKLGLRGSSRSKDGRENLIYFDGSFDELTNKIEEEIIKSGSDILKECKINEVIENNDTNLLEVKSEQNHLIQAKKVIFTTAPEITESICKKSLDKETRNQLTRIDYLGNVCMILFLDKSLSDFYWLNVNDPNFPFVGIIEHTNFDNTFVDNGYHVIYLSRYCRVEDKYFIMSDKEFLNVCKDSLKEMFPDFSEDSIKDFAIWRSKYSQPFMEIGYKSMIPKNELLKDKIFQISMANIYPEDRGTNCAVKYTDDFLNEYYDDK